jgi:tryptophan synthase alpha subunit
MFSNLLSQFMYVVPCILRVVVSTKDSAAAASPTSSGCVVGSAIVSLHGCLCNFVDIYCNYCHDLLSR